MATSAALLVLAACLLAGSGARQCYQSSCLPDNLLDCYSDQRASLRTCSYEDFLLAAQQLSPAILPESENRTSMVCVSFQATGELDRRTHSVVIRMCYPDVPRPCRSLEQHTRQHMTDYGISNSSLAFSCASCDRDGCNPAGRPAATAATVALLAAAAALARAW
ncbi:uncharacterized protein LOC134528132 [Bacillus rossius redtenbacheri]|uniref:uncharacterized protein LOC134528132 n=1 Tax=Bacillus rossius redtenbacheri TaxID=93214 RepID=UPI002FDCA017